MNNYYLDTSIWLDYSELREENGEKALRLIISLIIDNAIIIYSDLILKELRNVLLTETEINNLLGIARPDNIKRVHIFKEQLTEAKKIAKQRDVPLGDAIHVVVARDNEAILVSRDKDFDKLRDIVTTKIPEALF